MMSECDTRKRVLETGRKPQDSIHRIQYRNALYTGSCQNGVPHGFGTKTYSNGAYYKGK